MGRADVYLQPEAKDPVLSEATVLAIARTCTRRAGAVTEVDETGGEARAYLLDADVVVKTQRPHRLRPRTSLSKEARLLTQLAGPLGRRVPTVYGYGHHRAPQGDVEYIVMSRMPGRAARHGPVAPRVLDELGELLAELHGLPTEPLLDGEAPFPADNGTADLHERLEAGFADVIAAHPSGWPTAIDPDEVTASALALLPVTLTAVVLHSNPGPTHAFVDDGTLTGLIDFGDSYLSHPALDLRAWPHPADRVRLHDAYQRATPRGDDFRAVWNAAMILADLKSLATRPDLAGAAEADLLSRLKGR